MNCARKSQPHVTRLNWMEANTTTTFGPITFRYCHIAIWLVWSIPPPSEIFSPQHDSKPPLFQSTEAMLVGQNSCRAKTHARTGIASCSKCSRWSFRCRSAPIVSATKALCQIEVKYFDTFRVRFTHFEVFSSWVYRSKMDCLDTPKSQYGESEFCLYIRWNEFILCAV